MAEHDLKDAEVRPGAGVIGGRRLTIEGVVAVARDCPRALQLTGQAAAAYALATVQAARLRLRSNAAPVMLERELRAMTERIAAGEFVGLKQGGRP